MNRNPLGRNDYLSKMRCLPFSPDVSLYLLRADSASFLCNLGASGRVGVLLAHRRAGCHSDG